MMLRSSCIATTSTATATSTAAGTFHSPIHALTYFEPSQGRCRMKDDEDMSKVWNMTEGGL